MILLLLAGSWNAAHAGPLHNAVCTGDLALVQQLLDGGAEVNIDNDASQEFTPLHCAADRGHIEIVKLLLQRGADINGALNGTIARRDTPLHLATERYPEIGALLYSKGAKVLDPRDLVRLLVHAASRGDVPTIEKLLTAGADVNGHDAYAALEYDVPFNALTAAIEKDNAAVVSLLLERGASIRSGHIRRAICRRNLSLVKQLKERSNLADLGKNLGSVVECGDKDILNYFMEKFSPLDYASIAPYIEGNANAELFSMLFAQDQEFTARFSRLPVSLVKDAASNGNAKLLGLLFARGVSISTEDAAPALLAAAKGGATEAVDLLLQQKVAVDPRTDWGNTPLLLAAPLDFVAIATSLLRNGADVNAKNELSNTALHMACARNLTDMAALLIKAGAKVDAVNGDRNTPLLQAARFPNQFGCLTLLLENKANVNAQNSLGMTALHYLAVRDSDYDEVATASSGKEEEETDEDEEERVKSHQRPTELAPQETAILDAMRLLIAKGADLKIKNVNGQTALEMAQKYSKSAALKKLLETAANQRPS